MKKGSYVQEESLHISEAVMKLNLNTFSRLVAEMR